MVGVAEAERVWITLAPKSSIAGRELKGPLRMAREEDSRLDDRCVSFGESQNGLVEVLMPNPDALRLRENRCCL